MTMQLIKCTCSNAVQDAMYGQGNRLANEMRTGQLKCTVCGTIHGAKGSTQAEKIAAKVAAKEASKEKGKSVEKL